MKAVKLFLSASLLAFVFFSCDNRQDDSNDVPTIEKKVTLTQEEFLSIAFDNPKELSEQDIQFVIKMFEITLNKEILVKNNLVNASYNAKEKYYLSLDGKKRFASKSEANSSEIVPIYRYDLIQNTDTGFVFVSADERFPSVLAYVPKGDLNKKDDASVFAGIEMMLELSEESLLNNIKYFNHLKDSLRDHTLEKISKELEINVSEVAYNKVRDNLIVEGKPATKSIVIPQLSGTLGQIGPLVTTKWGQGQPYNYQIAEGCDEFIMGTDYVSHYPAGCLVTAAAQVLAHIQPAMQVTRVNGQSVTINWSQLKQTPSIEPGWSYFSGVPASEQNRIDMVSGLIKHIFNGTSTTPNCDGSSTVLNSMWTCLNSKISMGSSASGMNVTTVKSSLDAMKIVLAGGVRNKGTANAGSHAWIIDGYAICIKGVNTVISASSNVSTKELVNNYDLFLHANMGWEGTGDGYYYVNSNLTITFDPNVNLNNDGNYNYNSDFWFRPNLTSK
ncbi:hypothetical protein AGMMS50239_02390 [Bacteroidia bacterium]|nr:hypothetical protein AGMMS50239_02390 [Bacteroidia bacterium]